MANGYDPFKFKTTAPQMQESGPILGNYLNSAVGSRYTTLDGLERDERKEHQDKAAAMRKVIITKSEPKKTKTNQKDAYSEFCKNQFSGIPEIFFTGQGPAPLPKPKKARKPRKKNPKINYENV